MFLVISKAMLYVRTVPEVHRLFPNQTGLPQKIVSLSLKQYTSYSSFYSESDSCSQSSVGMVTVPYLLGCTLNSKKLQLSFKDIAYTLIMVCSDFEVASLLTLRPKLKFYSFPLTRSTLKKRPYAKNFISIFSQEFFFFF